MDATDATKVLMDRVSTLERELERLKRDLTRALASPGIMATGEKPSLFGRVKGGDITEEMIKEAKQSVIRDLQDL